MQFLHKNFLVPVLLVILLISGALYFFSSHTSQGLVSGTIDLNGMVPQGASISILTQQSGEKEFKTVVFGLSAENAAVWSWGGAVKGKTYTIKADVIAQGKVISESAPITVTATATEEVLRINSTYVPPPSFTTLQGKVDLNGAVTPESYISIYQKKSGEAEFSLITDALSATDGVLWSWADAVAGNSYEVKAVLTVNGEYAGESAIITMAAPASNEVLTINSQYSPPPTTVTVSGIFNINGQFPSGTTLSLFKKSPTDAAFVQIGSSISANNNTSWSWNGATQGVQYNIKAVAYQNGNSLSQSQILTVAAPASNETLTINAGIPTAQPPNSPTVQCVSQSGNTWTVNVNFQQVSGANKYWLTVGTQPRGNDVVNYQTGSTGQSTQTYTFSSITNGTTYYAQYATSTCGSCTQPTAFSPFSNLLQFSCFPATATPTPTPYPAQPTYTPYPTPTAIPTNLPTPTFTPTPTLPPNTSGCNQNCGGDGYQCAAGLQCSTSGLIGGNVCRNQNCTAETDCTCN